MEEPKLNALNTRQGKTGHMRHTKTWTEDKETWEQDNDWETDEYKYRQNLKILRRHDRVHMEC